MLLITESLLFINIADAVASPVDESTPNTSVDGLKMLVLTENVGEIRFVEKNDIVESEINALTEFTPEEFGVKILNGLVTPAEAVAI